uniref:Cytoplasmic phosphatidylinositol transfer protein 1 n=2 Tax=Clastoptera arizonana TaxID=38151 RepID=A0A1B6C760_9HEMI
MVYTKEYRICMPLSVEEYQIGQLYMIARHSHEQSESGEGVEVVLNCPCEHEVHGKGQYTEKRIHLSSRLPYWIQSFLPKVFYVIEKAWNYYPYTITEYTCSFLPKLVINIQTRFENNNGSNDNCLNLNEEELKNRTVETIDIAYDEINPKHYKEEEDLRFFQSKKTHRGPLIEGWQNTTSPIMCSYKFVQTSFEVWGLQTKVEELIQKSIRDILLLGHRQAFAWIDEWYGMSLVDVRVYEGEMQRQTNVKVADEIVEPKDIHPEALRTPSTSNLPEIPITPKTPTSPSSEIAPKSWFPWS